MIPSRFPQTLLPAPDRLSGDFDDACHISQGETGCDSEGASTCGWRKLFPLGKFRYGRHRRHSGHPTDYCKALPLAKHSGELVT